LKGLLQRLRCRASLVSNTSTFEPMQSPLSSSSDADLRGNFGRIVVS
jgi:hypothetical protein